MKKPIICLDFDGVVHSYVSGWQGACTINDPPMPGALDYITDLLLEGYDVVIHSSRSRHLFGIWAMRNWLRKHAGNQWDCMGPSLCDVRFTRLKPPAILTIDDRAMRFQGAWPSMKSLKTFKPYKHDLKYETLPGADVA